jgi:hypothetical protein
MKMKLQVKERKNEQTKEMTKNKKIHYSLFA